MPAPVLILALFIDWAKQRFKELPLYMMGHSLGGTAALNMALDHPGVTERARDGGAPGERWQQPKNSTAFATGFICTICWLV